MVLASIEAVVETMTLAVHKNSLLSLFYFFGGKIVWWLWFLHDVPVLMMCLGNNFLICFDISKEITTFWLLYFSKRHLSLTMFVLAKDASPKHAVDTEVSRNFIALACSKWFRGGFSVNVLHITLNHTHFNFFGPFPSLISSVFRLTVTDSNIASISPALQTGILSQAWRKAWRLFWRASLFKNNGAPVWNRKACVWADESSVCGRIRMKGYLKKKKGLLIS